MTTRRISIFCHESCPSRTRAFSKCATKSGFPLQRPTHFRQFADLREPHRYGYDLFMYNDQLKEKLSQRTLKLGNTIKTLHERLPTLLASPLPQEILSPQITLHLFPSTHPHLPKVSGRIPYSAALWTAPVAWGRVPVVGNVRLIILSERMIKPNASDSSFGGKLIVRWRTCGKTKGRGVGPSYKGVGGSGDQVDKITEFLGGDVERDDEEFSGLFIFEFDEEGRILTHTIEHAQEGGNWEKMTRFVSVTDWLLGLARSKNPNIPQPGLAIAQLAFHEQKGIS